MVLDETLAATLKNFFFIKTDFRCGSQQTANGSMSLLCEMSCEYNRRTRRNPSHHFLKLFDRGSLLVSFEQGRF
jgi:hypothetical protein